MLTDPDFAVGVQTPGRTTRSPASTGIAQGAGRLARSLGASSTRARDGATRRRDRDVAAVDACSRRVSRSARSRASTNATRATRRERDDHAVRRPRRARVRHGVAVGAGHARPGAADHDDHDDDHDDAPTTTTTVSTTTTTSPGRRPRPTVPADDARVARSARSSSLDRRDPGRGVPAPAPVRRRPRSRSARRARGRLPEGPEAGAIVGFVAGSASTCSSRRRSGSTRWRTRSSATASACSRRGCSARRAGCRRSSARSAGSAGGLLFIGVGVLAGVDAVKGTHGVVTISYAALYDALLAPFVFFLVRRVLGERRPGARRLVGRAERGDPADRVRPARARPLACDTRLDEPPACMSDNSRVRVSIVGVVIVALFARSSRACGSCRWDRSRSLGAGVVEHARARV